MPVPLDQKSWSSSLPLETVHVKLTIPLAYLGIQSVTVRLHPVTTESILYPQRADADGSCE